MVSSSNATGQDARVAVTASRPEFSGVLSIGATELP